MSIIVTLKRIAASSSNRTRLVNTRLNIAVKWLLLNGFWLVKSTKKISFIKLLKVIANVIIKSILTQSKSKMQ